MASRRRARALDGAARPLVCRRAMRRPRLPVTWLGAWTVLAMLMGCAVGPDFQSPDAPAVPGFLPGRATTVVSKGEGVSTQVAKYGHDIPGRWWELFHSRHLNTLIQDGIIRNAELEAAESAVRVAQANSLVAKAAL